MTKDSIIFPNEAACDGALEGKVNQYLANNPKVDSFVVTNIAKKIYSNDDSKVLIWLNNPDIRSLNWSPNAVVQTDTKDAKWI